jgi:hypothetical protein
VAQQLQFLLSGVPITSVREDIRTVQVVARWPAARGSIRRIGDFTLARQGQRIPLSQIGKVEVRMEEPVLRRRDRMPTITVRGDIADGLQPPDVSSAISAQLQPIIAKLPAGYRIEQAGAIEESGKATKAMLPLFPIMMAITAADHFAGAFDFGDGDGVPDQPAGPDRRGADAAPVRPALRHQCAGRPDRPVGHPDAQHADPDRPDPPQRSGRARSLPRRGRGHRAARGR